MKPFKTSSALIIGLLTLFSISNAKAAGCSSDNEKNSEIQYFSDDKTFIEANEKELLFQVED